MANLTFRATESNCSLSCITEFDLLACWTVNLVEDSPQKCKSLTKLTKNWIDMIRRKRKVMEKFLRKDIIDMKANGLDDRAYGRAITF
ncbi:hypothetical protein JHK85_040839 [Glycine max]|nr:hypothetical protein JHK87_040067 [Glycine soja]KAG4963385.1 hypothetical protein JHK86_040253 [Glycine max]KAG4965864.1 hypothetical protein JHK85_040839 [Glycine max]